MDAYSRLLNENSNFIYGVNLPWFGTSGNRYQTFGDNPFASNEVAYKHDELSVVLTNIASVGFTSVRTWIFTGFGGTKMDENGMITGLTPEFIVNLRDFLELIKTKNLTVNPILMPHIIQSLPPKGDKGETNGELQKKAVHIMTDEKLRNAFIENALIPALKIMNEYSDVIACLDLYCEPEGDAFETAGRLDIENCPGRVENLSDLTDFIKAESDAVKRVMPDMKCLVSSSYGQNYLKFNTYKDYGIEILGLDVYNNEGAVIIPDSRITPEIRDMISDIWVTECNHSHKKADIEATAYWTEEQFAKVILDFYESTKNAGYKACYMWHFAGSNGAKTSLTKNEKYPDYSAIRLSGQILHYNILDWNAKNSKNAEFDRPAALISLDKGCLRWLASRQAVSYEIQYKKDDVWCKLATLISGDKDFIYKDDYYTYENASYNYLYEYRFQKEFEIGNYPIRVVAFMDDDKTVFTVSEEI